ncbi:putative Transcription factor domain-containing protein [Seiridium unicorne]|uniref:Transcription factor domain-containing protein n=1 Tax=Seiridium unicorne TaxID=138068 RepID=A0ABR2V1X8_9PEZI
MSTPEKSEMQFIFTNGLGKTEPAKRKLIRKHVMLGKNRGKTRKGMSLGAADAWRSEELNGGRDGDPGLLINMRYSSIPNKIGSDFSFTQFAAAVEPPAVHDLIRFSFIAKRVMYPLERCIVFHKKTKIDTSWFEFLTIDAAYTHAAVFASQAYILLTSGGENPPAYKRAMIHHSAALRLLRERVSAPEGESKVSDPTVLVVLYLALHAHFVGDHDTAKQHMDGLRKIVDIRGGLFAFGYNTKLIMELMKCDLGIAIHNGTKPEFFNDSFSEPMIPYDLALLTTQDSRPPRIKFPWNLGQIGVIADLVQAWEYVMRFCSTINSAAETKRQLPKETLLNAMASVMYRLLHMNNLDITSANEAIRLGLLAFSSHIFLNWQNMKAPHTQLPDTYRRCLLNLKSPGALPSQVLLWLLMIGSVSVFSAVDGVWLLPWMRVNIGLCDTDDWHKLRRELKACPWIDVLHDKPGREIFDSAVLSQVAIGTVPV